jgi:hypothetical protein
MQFALLGDHPDGLDLARALAESGRHTLRIYSGSPVGEQYLQRWQLSYQKMGDMEEVLAHPGVEAVIVAGGAADRPAQLRRALQAERHVLCVHPCDQGPDTAFEAGLIQFDTSKVLMPLLTEALHPGVHRLAELIRQTRSREKRAEGITESAFPRLIEMDLWSAEAVVLDVDLIGHKPGFPGWQSLRVLAGEIVEVSGFAAFADLKAEDPVLLSGRFEQGGIFHYTLLPFQARPYYRIRVHLQFAPAELIFPDGWPGPAKLTWQEESGDWREEAWDSWNPWPRLVELFEEAVEYQDRLPPSVDRRFDETAASAPLFSWQNEIRCLELDQACRRSIEHRRSSVLEYQEAVEEASFKGTMTLVGCGVLLGSIVLLMMAVWLPWVLWVIGPMLVLFLGLQVLRWVVPGSRPKG